MDQSILSEIEANRSDEKWWKRGPPGSIYLTSRTTRQPEPHPLPQGDERAPLEHQLACKI
jgi:hypothetical protein